MLRALGRLGGKFATGPKTTTFFPAHSRAINFVSDLGRTDECIAPIASPNVYYRGHHVVLDITNAAVYGKENVDKMGRELLDAMATAAREAGANVLMTHIEVFDGEGSPPGFASVVLLDESHITAHCYSETGLIAIDAFTCGEDPSCTERVADHIAKHVTKTFPEASLDVAAMRRFGHFDISEYLREYYGGDSLSTDNQSLLTFFDGAYNRIFTERAGQPFRVLEVGGGPTMYQLLSAGKHASEIVFTDLLHTNVDHVRKRCWEFANGATKGITAEWGTYADYVAALEGGDGVDPLERLCGKINQCHVLDVSAPGSFFAAGSFDVMSACFVFEASGEAIKTEEGGRDWRDHLTNAARLLKDDGHIVLTVVLSPTGVVTEGGRELLTPKISAEDVQHALEELGFGHVNMEVIDSKDTDKGIGQFAAVTARKMSTAAAAIDPAKQATYNAVASYVRNTYRHFNSKALIEAADGYKDLLANDGKMFLTLAGAMSTAEIGVSLAEMIRLDKVHAISCTGANLEEDFFNLVAHDSYTRIPDWRGISKAEEQNLYDSGLNRVTDTCIPEEEAFRTCEKALLGVFQEACESGETIAPHELFYRLINRRTLADKYQIDPADSWLVAAAEKNLPIVCPGWEDSTCGNIIVANKIAGNIPSYPIESGLEQMERLVDWYLATQEHHKIGFFQIGGGIAGDFPVCVVPLIRQDLERLDCSLWSYFCQVSDGTTSYGGYSAAPPNEKISWGKLSPTTPSFIVESDATIVWPLVCSVVLSDQ